MAALETQYRERQEEHLKKAQALQARYNLVAIARLLSFVGFLYTAYRALKEAGTAGWVITGLLLVVFFFLVRLAQDISGQKKLQQKLAFLNLVEYDLQRGQANQFDDGKIFLRGESHLSDLDIFGYRSLFHVLNRTTTQDGQEHLASLLRQPLPARPDILDKQEAIQTLAPQTDLRQMITALGLVNEEKGAGLDSVRDWLQSPNRLLPLTWLQVVRFLLPAFNLVALYILLDTGNEGLLLAGLLANGAILYYFRTYIRDQHDQLTKKEATLEQYAGILHTFQKLDSGHASLLTRLKEQAQDADIAIRQLSKLSGLLDQRTNLVIAIFFNGLGLYDIHCLMALEGWKKKYAGHFSSWAEAVGMIESLNSLAGFSYNHPDFCFPQVTGGAPHIRAEGLAHPLIPGNERVANDTVIGPEERILLITGSNMSGKTTFLRTIGINLVLAQCGAPVCAGSFAFTPMIILSSIRINDSLLEQTSYFLAELKRLQYIIGELEKGIPALVLTDEILRGTNSDDKTHGSEQFIQKLTRFNCLVLFATHDLALGALESEYPGLVANYCFESLIRQGELSFDYRIRRGIAQNKNASFLMEKMGIIG